MFNSLFNEVGAMTTRLLIACALPEELGTEPLPGDTPVVWTGVGKINTAIAVTRAIARHQHGVGWQAMKYITDDADSADAQDWISQVRQGLLLFRQWLAQRLGVSA